MDPSDLYAQTLSVLTSARSTMLSPAWQAAMGNQTQAMRVAAAHQLGQLQSAINALGNKSLSDIATAMQASAAGLTQSTQALDDALRDITQVQNIMASVTSILNVVAEITDWAGPH
ncbi:MAG: hypothetical protein P4N24_14580 [Acidobacteriota bacterium]|nr:hypothetical protein [Acidobacteriota bacterium]